jgi:hypothetical protein
MAKALEADIEKLKNRIIKRIEHLLAFISPSLIILFALFQFGDSNHSEYASIGNFSPSVRIL